MCIIRLLFVSWDNTILNLASDPGPRLGVFHINAISSGCILKVRDGLLIIFLSGLTFKYKFKFFSLFPMIFDHFLVLYLFHL